MVFVKSIQKYKKYLENQEELRNYICTYKCVKVYFKN